MRFPYQNSYSAARSEPRFEVVPLLDCVFQLLIFAIYCMAVMVHAQLMPVKLPTLSSAQAATPGDIAAITVDSAGQLFLNQKAMTADELRTQLKAIHAQAKPPAVYLALETQKGSVDRAPMVIQLIDTLRSAGIKDFNIVGAPPTSPAPSALTPNP